MLTYDLKVGYACNNKCQHCVIDDSKDKLVRNKQSTELTTDECIQQIEYARKKGATSIVLTGGEVTIRKDFRQLINKCIDNNLSITVQTNGRMLSRNKLIDAVKDIRDIRFVIALHGNSEETHDQITQVCGSFKETCEGIRAMANIGKLVIVKVVISKFNMSELPAIVKLSFDLGVKYICFAFPHGQGAARKNFNNVIPRYNDLKPFLDETINEAQELHVNIEFEAVPFCIIPNSMQLVGELKFYDGDTLCRQVNEEPFDWNEIRKDIKLKGPSCKKCDMNEFCEGPWSEYPNAFGFDELKPIRFRDTEKVVSGIKKYLKSIPRISRI